MADSPAVYLPLDPREQPILERLLSIRDALLLLKQDKSTYIKSQQVISFYDQIVDQIQQLTNIRPGGGSRERNRGSLMS
jgi:hypothetical protein